MKNLLIYIITFMITSLNLFSQDFNVEPLITMQGDNTNYSIVHPPLYYNSMNSYICWQNQTDSVYTLYLKQIDPFSDENILISTDTSAYINPKISFNFYYDSLLITWGKKNLNKWKVYYKTFKNDILSECKILLDSVNNAFEYSINSHCIAWTMNGYLYYATPFGESGSIDSNYCSNPVLNQNVIYYDPFILYEKGYDNKQIYLGRYIGQYRERKPYWELQNISYGENNINPAFGMDCESSFQTLENNIWKICVCKIFSEYYTLTKNKTCNFTNPSTFIYPIFTKNITTYWNDFFLAFDSDSFPNNQEVYICKLINWIEPSNDIINISNSEGIDQRPTIAYLNSSLNNSQIAIIWEHIENNKTDIWWATTDFILPQGVVTDDIKRKHIIELFYNYPNPFNSSTIISYQIDKPSLVRIKIFNINGQLIETLVNSFMNNGKYNVEWTPENIYSGIYFCKISINNITTKSIKLIVLK